MFALLLMTMAALASPSSDVYEPVKKPALATVVFVHGGAWVGGDKSEYASLAPTFTSQGYRFVAINYRLAPGSQHPSPVEDLNASLAKYEKIVMVGHSAGAHMIAFWNTAHTNSHVLGFVGIEGIYDLAALVKTWPSYKDWFVAKEFGSAEKWPAASPALLPVKSKAPWLVIHSTKDELVDLAQSTAFVAHLRKEGAPVDFVQLKTESHFETVSSLRDPKSEAAKAVLKFISERR